MKYRILILLLILCTLFLTGCFKSLDSGVVVSKSYHPAHKVYSPMIMRSGKNTIIIPRWITYSDKYEIQIQNGDDIDWWTVSETYYRSVEVGDAVERRTK